MKSNHNAIIYKSRRGLKELDVILEKFNESELKHLSEKQIVVYKSLLDNEDIELFELLSNQKKSKNKQEAQIIEMIKCYQLIADS